MKIKRDLIKLVKWFCLRLTYNDLASVIGVLHEVLAGMRSDIELKPKEASPNYRNFRTDELPPLPAPKIDSEPTMSWKELRDHYRNETGKELKPVCRRGGKEPPSGSRCEHCNAPTKFLYLNNGKEGTQVRCKVCGKTGTPMRKRRQSTVKYICPHCNGNLSAWKESRFCITFKCMSYTCPHYLRNKKKLTAQEKQARKDQPYNPNYKLHYQYCEFDLAKMDLRVARPEEASKVDLRKIHNNYHTVGLVLTFTINLGLSSRTTRDALKGIFGIKLSHQTVLNYVNAASAYLSPFIDKNLPKPSATAAADETYIIVESQWHYTWFIIDSETRALCGYNLSNNRGTEAALGLLYDCYGNPKEADFLAELTTDGLGSYGKAVHAFNSQLDDDDAKLSKRTVIGLKNLDEESTEYRSFKQLIERLNRTYKYHTRPRAGFKTFAGAVSLTTLFVAYYNFMRPHTSLKGKVPVKLDCLNGDEFMPEAWVRLLKSA